MPFDWGAAASIGSTVLGGMFGSDEADDAQDFSAEQAARQMDFQREMSDTAHRS